MATLTKVRLANGETRWRMRFYTGRDPETGRQEFVISTFERKRDADDEVARLRNLRRRGGVVAPSNERLGPFLEGWLQRVKKGTLRPRTYLDYRSVLRRYIREPPSGAPVLGKLPLSRVTPQAIEELYRYLREEEGLSPRTVRRLHAVLRQGLAYAAKHGSVAGNVADLVDLPAMVTREVRAMTSAEAARFLTAAGEDRNFALWSVLLGGGVRPGEALGLRWADVDLDASKIHIQRSLVRRGVPKTCACGHPRGHHDRKGTGPCLSEDCDGCEAFRGVDGWRLQEPKTPRSRRVVVLPAFAIGALREWRVRQAKERLQLGAEYEDSGLVFTTEFGRPLDSGNLSSRAFPRIMARANLGEWEPPPPKAPGEPGPGRAPRFRPAYRVYDLRHTAATLLLRAGVNPKVVSERLGHASVAFTLDVYAATLPDMQGEAAEKLEAMLREQVDLPA